MIVHPNSTGENPLWNYFANNTGRVIHKWHHYFDIYHNHFQRFRDRDITFVEVGVFKGGSLEMWKNYFGPRARIIGVDIDPATKAFEEDRIEIVIGDQADPDFLRSLREITGPVDVFVDDGGHTMTQQLVTFDEMFSAVKPDGVYLIEDLHTSYWEEYGGGYAKPGTFIEFSKSLIDRLNAWHSRAPELVPDAFTKSVTGLHFYDSVIAIEKQPNPEMPKVSMTGLGA